MSNNSSPIRSRSAGVVVWVFLSFVAVVAFGCGALSQRRELWGLALSLCTGVALLIVVLAVALARRGRGE
jgi:hypothetical protein